MELKQLNDLLKYQAKVLNACEKGLRDWDGVEDKDELIERYMNNLEFAIEHDFPSCEFMRENFSRMQLATHGVFVNEHELNVKGRSGTFIFNGNCDGKFIADKYAAARLYVRHETILHIDAKHMSSVFVDVYDDAEVFIQSDSLCKAYVYAHNGLDKVHCDGNVIVRDKKG